MHINVNNEILNLIAEIDEFKGAWKLFGQLTPNRLQALKTDGLKLEKSIVTHFFKNLLSRLYL